MSDEPRKLAKTWWCHGGGLAVLFLLAVVVWFRDARDVIFWASVAFFVAHLAMTGWRYHADRRSRTSATVLRHHRAHRVGDPVTSPTTSMFVPMPIGSLIRLDVPPK